MSRPIVCNGVTYESVKAMTEAYGVSYSKVAQRLHKGKTPEEAVFSGRYKPGGTSKKVTVFGIEHESVKAACVHHEVSYAGVYTQLGQGSTLENAIQNCVELLSLKITAKKITGNNGVNLRWEPVTVRGVTYPSCEHFMKAINKGASHSVRDIRAKLGVSYSEACEIWLAKHEKKQARSEELKIQREAKRVTHEELLAKREASRIVIGPFTAISQCPVCSKIWASGYRQKHNSLCSDNCRETAKKAHAAKNKKQRRDEGRDCHGKHAKRAARNNVPAVGGITARAIAKKDGMTCMMCGCETEPHRGQGWQPRGWSVGHVISLATGGPHTWENVWLECSECNSRKGSRNLPGFAFMPAEIPRPRVQSARVRESLLRSYSFDENQSTLFDLPIGQASVLRSEPAPATA